MSRVSKKFINKDFEKELEEHLSFIVSSLSDKKEINVFLNEFLTDEEKKMLGKRLILYALLYRGFSNSDINSALSMSFETIRWYKEVYNDKSEVFKKIINKIIKREKSKEFWKKIDKILEPLALALESKTNMRSRARFASGDFWKE